MNRSFNRFALAAVWALTLPGCAAIFSSERPLVAIPGAPPAPGAYSRSTAFDGLLFTSGVFPGDPATGAVLHGDIEAQTDRVLDNLEAILKRAGCTMKDVVKVSVQVADARDLPRLNESISTRFGANAPALTTRLSGTLPGFARLELDFVARLP